MCWSTILVIFVHFYRRNRRESKKFHLSADSSGRSPQNRSDRSLKAGRTGHQEHHRSDRQPFRSDRFKRSDRQTFSGRTAGGQNRPPTLQPFNFDSELCEPFLTFANTFAPTQTSSSTIAWLCMCMLLGAPRSINRAWIRRKFLWFELGNKGEPPPPKEKEKEKGIELSQRDLKKKKGKKRKGGKPTQMLFRASSLYILVHSLIVMCNL